MCLLVSLGEGEFVCQDGRSYVGEWMEGKRHGKVRIAYTQISCACILLLYAHIREIAKCIPIAIVLTVVGVFCCCVGCPNLSTRRRGRRSSAILYRRSR